MFDKRLFEQTSVRDGIKCTTIQFYFVFLQLTVHILGHSIKVQDRVEK